MKFQLETERLFLRELNVNDAENFYLLNKYHEVIKYTGDSSFENIESAKEFLENYDQYEKYGIGRWAVILKSTNEFIGWSGLKFSVETKEIDLGFRLFRKDWGKGYATESALKCLQYGFDKKNYSKIVGRAMKENLTSHHILKKLGFRFQKEFIQNKQTWIQYVIEKE